MEKQFSVSRGALKAISYQFQKRLFTASTFCHSDSETRNNMKSPYSKPIVAVFISLVFLAQSNLAAQTKAEVNETTHAAKQKAKEAAVTVRSNGNVEVTGYIKALGKSSVTNTVVAPFGLSTKSYRHQQATSLPALPLAVLDELKRQDATQDVAQAKGGLRIGVGRNFRPTGHREPGDGFGGPVGRPARWVALLVG